MHTPSSNKSAGRGRKSRKQHRPRAQATTARVLLVVLRDLRVELSGEVKMENIFWTMTQLAKVEKVSLFVSQKDSKEQALVQFETHDGAQQAMEYINGRPIASCGSNGAPFECTFVAVFSTVPELSFKKNDDKNHCYDEVNARLATTARCTLDFVWGEHRSGEGWLIPRQEEHMRGRIPESKTALPQGKVGTCIYVSGLPDPVDEDTPYVTAEMLFRICSQYGDIVVAKVLSQAHNAKKAILQFRTEDDAEALRQHFEEFPLFGDVVQAKPSTLPNASNWSGALSELWTFSIVNEPAGPVAATKCPPSRAVTVANWHRAEGAVFSCLKRHSMDDPTFIAAVGADALLEFATPEEAFMLVGRLNGRTEGGHTVRVCFAAPITQADKPTRCMTEPLSQTPQETVCTLSLLITFT